MAQLSKYDYPCPETPKRTGVRARKKKEKKQKRRKGEEQREEKEEMEKRKNVIFTYYTCATNNDLTGIVRARGSRRHSRISSFRNQGPKIRDHVPVMAEVQ